MTWKKIEIPFNGCSKFFTPTIVNMELQLFCSKECEKKSDEYWERIINE